MPEIDFFQSFVEASTRIGSYRRLKLESGQVVSVDPRQLNGRLDLLSPGHVVMYDPNGVLGGGLSLLRGIGKIDRFIASEGYGFITAYDLDPEHFPGIRCEMGKPNFFFHQNSACCAPECLVPTTMVSFIIRRSRHHGAFRYAAEEVQPLTDGINPELIKHCFTSETLEVWSSVIPQYLALESVAHQEKERALMEKFFRLRTAEKRRMAARLAAEFLARCPSLLFELRRYLDTSHHVRILIHQCAASVGTRRQELVDQLADHFEQPEADQRLWEDVPDSVIAENKLCRLAPFHRLIGVYQGWLMDANQCGKALTRLSSFFGTLTQENQDSLLEAVFAGEWLTQIAATLEEQRWQSGDPQLQARLKALADMIQIVSRRRRTSQLDVLLASIRGTSIAQQPDSERDYWSKLPDPILFQPTIWEAAPADVCLESLVRWLDDSNHPKAVLDRLVDAIPDLTVDQRDRIFGQFSYKELMLQLADYGASSGATNQTYFVDQIGKVLKHLPLCEEKTAGFAKHTLIMKRRKELDSLPDFIQREFDIRKELCDIPAALSRFNKSDWELIRDFVRGRRIQRLIHLTKISNMHGILQEQAILSVSQIRDRSWCFNNNIPWTPKDTSRADGYLNHVCCSIYYYNMHMFYRDVNQFNEPLMQLVITPEYLWKEGTLYCPMNAAYQCGNYVTRGLLGIMGLYADEVVDKRRLHTRAYKPSDLPTCVQAEILISDGVALCDVTDVIVRTERDAGLVRQAGWEGSITVAPFEFNYVSRWKR